MKKLIPLIIIVCSLNFLLTGCGSDLKAVEGNKANEVKYAENKVSPIDGSWELVWENVGGKIRNDGKSTQFKMFHNGFFSFVMQAQDGKWLGGAGTFTLVGNVYKETFKYCTVPEYVGVTDWQGYELKNDTLYFEGFTKAIYADGRDMTNEFPKFEEIRVKAK